MKPGLHLHTLPQRQPFRGQAAVGGPSLSKGHKLMTSRLLLLEKGLSIPVSSVLMPPSFPGKQAQRGRETGPRSHRSLMAPSTPRLAQAPRIPRQGGSSAHVA